jgi:hypothetical protein
MPLYAAVHSKQHLLATIEQDCIPQPARKKDRTPLRARTGVWQSGAQRRIRGRCVPGLPQQAVLPVQGARAHHADVPAPHRTGARLRAVVTRGAQQHRHRRVNRPGARRQVGFLGAFFVFFTDLDALAAKALDSRRVLFFGCFFGVFFCVTA